MPQADDGIRGWQRNLAIVWIAQFVAFVAFSVFAPILPLYVRRLGVTDEAQVQMWAGVIFSAPAVTMAVVSPIWGALSDRYGRKIMFVRAAIGGAAIIALMGFATGVEQLVTLRAIQGVLSGTVTAATVLVATTVPKNRVGSSLGMLQMAVYAGSSTGPLVGGFVADFFSYRSTFFVTAVLLLITGLAVMFFVRERDDTAQAAPASTQAAPAQTQAAPAQTQGAPESTQRTAGANLTSRVRGRMRAWLALPGASLLLSVFAINLLARLGPRIVAPVLTLFVEYLSPDVTRVASMAGLVSGASAAAGAVGSFVLGRVCDRVGPRPVLIGSIGINTVGYVLQFTAPSVGALAGFQAITGFAMGGILAALGAFLALLAPHGQEGAIYGVNASVSSAANAIGPLVGSAVAVALGLRFPFLASAVMLIAAGVATAVLSKPREARLECAPAAPEAPL